VTELPPGVRVPAPLRRSGGAAADGDDGLAEAIRALWPLPKVELHLHLEGSLRPETVGALAARHAPHSPLCRPGWQEGYWTFRDLAGFVAELGEVIRACIRTPDDYYRVGVECFEDLAAQHVCYAEVGFGPRTVGRAHYVPIEDSLAALDQARRDVEARTDVRIGLLVGLGRHHAALAGPGAEAQALDLVERAVRLREGGAAVVGIDLHGDEAAHPSVEPFVAAYRAAADAGLGLRAHAGEASGPATVWETVRRLGVTRLGHGVRAVEDPALVAHLARSNVALDVCPTSNLRTGLAPTLEAHPIRALRDAGLTLTVSSDDPGVFDTTVTTELALLHARLGFSPADLRRLTLNAAAHAFLPEPERAALAREVADGWPIV
jgi:adenosine deaminase